MRTLSLHHKARFHECLKSKQEPCTCAVKPNPYYKALPASVRIRFVKYDVCVALRNRYMNERLMHPSSYEQRHETFACKCGKNFLVVFPLQRQANVFNRQMGPPSPRRNLILPRVSLLPNEHVPLLTEFCLDADNY